MFVPVLIGIVAALVATFPPVIRVISPQTPFFSPIFVLGVAVIAMICQRFLIDRRPGSRAYDGLADLMITIHSPANPDSPRRWGVRGIVSLLLSIFGGHAGAEGASAEISQALTLKLRPRSARWFEQRRRTDVAMALSAAVAAAFNAPFAAVLLPIELSVGGKTVSSVLSALSAFLTAQFMIHLAHHLGLSPEIGDLSGAFSGFHSSLMNPRAWLAVALITALSALIGTLAIQFVRYSQESLLDLFQTQAWIRTVAGGILLYLVALVYPQGNLPAPMLLQRVLSGNLGNSEVALLFCTHLLGLALVLSAFGTIGIIWPVFTLGAFLGFSIDHTTSLTALQGGMAGLIGASAFFGVILGAPIAGALLAYEMTQNLTVLFPCLVAGLAARQIRIWLGTGELVSKDLQARGVSLAEGRASTVLDTVFVRDAMITDFETVHEHEPVSEIHSRLIKSRYPFLPVVNTAGIYLGLLTVDMVQEGWQAQDPLASFVPLSKLLEAKDLLYRTGFKTPTVKVNDRLSSASGCFDEVPCVPVLAEEGKVLGLLFVYSIRLAYDREAARRSLSFQADEP